MSATHGTWARYQAGCREDCCTSAARNYQKRRHLDVVRGMPRMVPSIGTERRIHALEAIGWDRETIGTRLGHSRAWVQQVLRGNPRIWRVTAEKVAALYDELSEVEPPTRTSPRRNIVARTKNRAKANGWAPPSAWFGVDIDDPEAEPDPGWTEPKRASLPVLIEDFDWLLTQGESEHSAAARLGIKRLDSFKESRRRLERGVA